MACVERAHDDIHTFFEFVIRDEKTQARIKEQPFQWLVLEFLLEFPTCVLMMPTGCSKTTLLLTHYLWRLGRNVMNRGAYVSKESGLAQKFVTLAKTYIETSTELNLVFPGLRPSKRKSDPWSQDQFMVERPPGAKDPSLVGVGIGKTVVGSRLSDIMADDVLTAESTRSREQRDKMWELHEAVLLHRLDPVGSSYIATGTAWDNDDFLHRLMNPKEFGEGVPALLLDIYGNVFIKNVPTSRWDPPGLRPADSNIRGNKIVSEEGPFRLTGNDAFAKTPEERESVPLWPSRWPVEKIAEKELKMTQVGFNQTYLLKCRSDETARCKREWIEACKVEANRLQHTRPVSKYSGEGVNVMGVDLAFGIGEAFDQNAIVVTNFQAGGVGKVLDVQTLQCSMPDMADLVYARSQDYENCHVVVESNGAQIVIKQALLKRDRGMNIHAFYTGGSGKANKWDVFAGVESVFTMIRNKALLFPCDDAGRVHRNIQRLIDACLYYLPEKHTADELMALWFGCWYARKVLAWNAVGDGAGGAGLYR